MEKMPMEEKILGLYACGMSQQDIPEQIKSLYDVDISPELVSRISEKIMPEVTAWQNRPLETVYPFVFLDAIHYKVRKTISTKPRRPMWFWASPWTAQRTSWASGSGSTRAANSG